LVDSLDSIVSVIVSERDGPAHLLRSRCTFAIFFPTELSNNEIL
jgi:hypothetical protein